MRIDLPVPLSVPNPPPSPIPLISIGRQPPSTQLSRPQTSLPRRPIGTRTPLQKLPPVKTTPSQRIFCGQEKKLSCKAIFYLKKSRWQPARLFSEAIFEVFLDSEKGMSQKNPDSTGGVPKEWRRRCAEKRLSKRVFLESPFLLCPLKVFRCFKSKR